MDLAEASRQYQAALEYRRLVRELGDLDEEDRAERDVGSARCLLEGEWLERVAR